MANSRSLLNSQSVFDTFLFAPVGEDRKGTVVSVLTAFARLNFEPWQKAADFASLPKDAAKTKLAAMIATLPGMSPSTLEPGAVAARLVALLPASARPTGLTQPPTAQRGGWLSGIPFDLHSPRSRALIGFLLAMWLVSQVVWIIQQPSQSVAVDPNNTSQTTVPQTQPK